MSKYFPPEGVVALKACGKFCFTRGQKEAGETGWRSGVLAALIEDPSSERITVGLLVSRAWGKHHVLPSLAAPRCPALAVERISDVLRCGAC